VEFREAIGQSFIYRIGYRFVVVVWVDVTKEKSYRLSAGNPDSVESKFIKELEDYNIFCMIK